jgi:hypothetical protein
MNELLVTEGEIQTLTGYKRPSRQVDELRRRGFHRARRNHAGQVILERAHYDAVCTGQAHRGTTDNAPQLRLA